MSSQVSNLLDQWLPKFGGLYTVRGRLIALLGLILVFTLLLIGIGVLSFIYRTEAAAWRDRQGEAAHSAAYQVAVFVQRADDGLDLAGLLGQNNLDIKAQVLDKLVQQNRALLEVICLNRRGEVVASAFQDQPLLANLFTISQSQWFLTAQNGQRYHGSIELSSQSQPYLIIALPTPDGNIIAARVQMNILWDVVRDIRFGQNGRAYVVSRVGQIIAHTNPAVVLANTNLDMQPELLTALHSPSGEWFGEYRDLQGSSVVGATTTVPGTDWIVITELPQSEAFAASRTALFWLGGSMLLFGLLVMRVSARSLEHLVLWPLEKLREGAERIGRGDLTYHIDLHRRDEIGHVATAFNQMTDELRELYADLEQKIAERTRDLEQQRAGLERSNAELAQFAYIASHDLQEPLRMVTSYLQLLKRRYKAQLDATALEFIDFAIDGATRMLQLIKDLLAYSRVGTHGQPSTPTDCMVVLDHTLANLKLAIEESGAIIKHDQLPTIVADPIQIGQLFQNLISNALKFRSEQPPTIHIGVERGAGEWIFCVQDNGIGIEPQYAERIFLIFQRLHTSDKYPGTGIGLAVCKKIVERHGGRIWVNSTPRQGTTFYFTISEKSME